MTTLIKTEIFKTFEDFEKRTDTAINGVSEELSGCNPGYDVSAELEAYDSIESYVLSECNPGYDVSAELEAYDSIESYESDAPELSYRSAVEGLK